MNPLDCPACGKTCLSAFRKVFLGPARSVACANCGARVSVAWLPSMALISIQAIVALVASVTAAKLVSPVQSLYALPVAAGIGALLASIPFVWAYSRFVPLRLRR